jgi:hypothetical protein
VNIAVGMRVSHAWVDLEDRETMETGVDVIAAKG